MYSLCYIVSMDTTKPISTGNHNSKSELEKFKLFYEYVDSDKDVRSQEKQQRPIRRRNSK